MIFSLKWEPFRWDAGIIIKLKTSQFSSCPQTYLKNPSAKTSRKQLASPVKVSHPQPHPPHPNYLCPFYFSFNNYTWKMDMLTSKCLLWNSITICNNGCRGYQAWENLLHNQCEYNFFLFLTPTLSKCYRS